MPSQCFFIFQIPLQCTLIEMMVHSNPLDLTVRQQQCTKDVWFLSIERYIFRENNVFLRRENQPLSLSFYSRYLKRPHWKETCKTKNTDRSGYFMPYQINKHSNILSIGHHKPAIFTKLMIAYNYKSDMRQHTLPLPVMNTAGRHSAMPYKYLLRLIMQHGMQHK